MRIPIVSFYQTNLYHHTFRVNNTFRILPIIPKTSIKKSFISFKKTFSTNTSDNEIETKQLVFEGPNARLIRILKIFSISTFGVCVYYLKNSIIYLYIYVCINSYPIFFFSSY
jgi:hypothetical protein